MATVTRAVSHLSITSPLHRLQRPATWWIQGFRGMIAPLDSSHSKSKEIFARIARAVALALSALPVAVLYVLGSLLARCSSPKVRAVAAVGASDTGSALKPLAVAGARSASGMPSTATAPAVPGASSGLASELAAAGSALLLEGAAAGACGVGATESSRLSDMAGRSFSSPTLDAELEALCAPQEARVGEVVRPVLAAGAAGPSAEGESQSAGAGALVAMAGVEQSGVHFSALGLVGFSFASAGAAAAASIAVSVGSDDIAVSVGSDDLPQKGYHPRDLAPKKKDKSAERLARPIGLDLPQVVIEGTLASWAQAREHELEAPFPVPVSFWDTNYEALDPVLDASSGYLAAKVEAKGRRITMEDQMLVTSLSLKEGAKVPLYAVFDGHGGVKASLYLKEHAAAFFTRALDEFSSLENAGDEAIEQVLTQACIQLDQEICRQGFVDGSTMTMALILKGHVWCVNVGDSRTVLLDAQGKSVQMSQDAKPHVERFQKSVVGRGGYVLFGRVDGQLGVARAFGDKDMVGVTARPKITKRPLGQGLALVCDGVTDVWGSEQIGDHLAASLSDGLQLDRAAYQLMRASILAGSADNISVLLVDTRKPWKDGSGLPAAWQPALTEQPVSENPVSA